MLLPPLVALPVVIGFLFVVLGAELPVAEPPPPNWTMIYVGAAILVGNAVFWPLLFQWQGKRRREQMIEEAKAKAARQARERQRAEAAAGAGPGDGGQAAAGGGNAPEAGGGGDGAGEEE